MVSDLICHRCKTPNGILWSHAGMYFCDDCVRYRTPPILTLTRLWSQDTSRFYNPKIKAFEPMATHELYDCGFMLYNHKKFMSQKVNSFFSDIFVFRFFGNVVCNKIKDYDYWPIDFRECDNCAF